MTSRVTRWVVPLAGSAVALLLIGYLYRGIDFGSFVAGLRNANLWWIAALAAAILLEQVISGWKWRQILHDVRPISTLRLTGALLAGYGANVLVPLGISPLVRSWLVARMEALAMGTVLTTTIIARFIDGVAFAFFAGFVALTGMVPRVEGNLQLGLAVAGALNLVLFGALLWAMFRFETLVARDGPIVCRLFDRVAGWFRASGAELRRSLSEGVVWPRSPRRRVAIVVGAFSTKLVAATHFLWAGLAVGVVLTPFDYLFLMVFAGFSMILSRFVQVPGGFVIGSAFALSRVGVPDDKALTMILFSYGVSTVLVVGIGLIVLWRSGIDIRQARLVAESRNASD